MGNRNRHCFPSPPFFSLSLSLSVSFSLSLPPSHHLGLSLHRYLFYLSPSLSHSPCPFFTPPLYLSSLPFMYLTLSLALYRLLPPLALYFSFSISLSFSLPQFPPYLSSSSSLTPFPTPFPSLALYLPLRFFPYLPLSSSASSSIYSSLSLNLFIRHSIPPSIIALSLSASLSLSLSLPIFPLSLNHSLSNTPISPFTPLLSLPLSFSHPPFFSFPSLPASLALEQALTP